MGKALYRKYRSKSLDELVGQEHITKTLAQALKRGAISHAYLFTGPRGVGKTSVARILAHAVNDLPYNEETTQIDIIEIDAASNRRIEEIRDLRDKVHIAPTTGKYKVYIIDEVHMLTREAFNALLKTLEEPPEHVIFILATTEAHKLPETIISRTQRFTFKPIDNRQVVDHLQAIAQKEAINISPDALQLIAQHGGGSFRDSISLLDQASNIGKSIDKEAIERLLGVAPQQAVNDLFASLNNGSPKDVLEQLQKLYEQGYQAASIAKQLSAKLRQHLIDGSSQLEPRKITSLLAKLLEVAGSPEPNVLLELVLIEPALDRQPAIQADIATPPPAQPVEPRPAKPIDQPPAPSPAATPAAQATTQKEPTDEWSTVLSTLKKRHNTLYSIVRMAEPDRQKDRLVLKFVFPFHQKRLSDAKNQQLLQEVIAEVTGHNLKIECTVDKQAQPPAVEPSPAAAANDPSIDTISNIFGSAELLE